MNCSRRNVMENEIDYVSGWQYGNAVNALRMWRDEVDDDEEICAYCGEPLIADEKDCPGCGQPATKLNEEDWRTQ
jgi:rubrerythrin